MYVSRQQFFPSLLLCLLLVGLSLASCSSGTTSPATNKSMTLKVAQVTNAIIFFPLYVAEQENFFKAQGLTLDPSPPPLLNSGSKLAAAVEANSVEVGIGGLTDAFTISRVDAYIKLIGAVSNDFLIDVIASKHFEQQTHLTATSPLADKVRALVGKKIGVSSPNSATDALVTYLFRQQKLDAQKDATKVYLGADVAAGLAGLRTGRVDAVVVASPAGVIAETKNFGDTFISPVRGDIPEMTGQLFGVAYAKQQVIDAKPQAVQAFIRGLAMAETFIQKNPDKTLALLGKYLKLDQKTLNLAWSATKASMPQTPMISQQAYDVANQFHVKAGLITLPLAYKNLVATDAIDKALHGWSSSS